MSDFPTGPILTPSLALAWPVAQQGDNAALIAFALYIAGVLILAAAANRLLRSRAFLSEYFLGSRSLGVWAFALTFAATSASGGSFIGFPSLVYTHGWVVALWIGSYMIVPIVAMGLLGKRLNQLGRQCQAITIPDILRDRFQCPSLGTLATCLIVFLMVVNLVAQFKGGSMILQSLLQDVPLFQQAAAGLAQALPDGPLWAGPRDNPGYLLCLLVFAVVVILYTTYGGFRAVVWTDVMQGFVMLLGVLIMLPLALWAVGGLGQATRQMAAMTPPRHVQLQLTLSQPLNEGALYVPRNSWLVIEEEGVQGRRVFRTAAMAWVASGQQTATASDGSGGRGTSIPAIELTYPPHVAAQQPSPLDADFLIQVLAQQDYAAGADQAGSYVRGPGPHAHKVAGFLPFSLAVSFFFYWAFSGAGQPSNMVRLMAFDNFNTLRRAIFTVSIYYTLIYFPLLIIFCCARVLLPGWETDSDRIMPEMAKATSQLIQLPWLAGLLVAAPFAAVMSTMDSFLLMISSALVRDLYQRHWRPQASERTLKRLTFMTTITVGVLAMLAAVYPPAYLQDIVVFTGTGLSTSFLIPVVLLLYWPRFNWQGAIAGMLAGFLSHVGMYALGTWWDPQGQITAWEPWNFHPFLWGTAVSLVVSVGVTWLTPPPPVALVRRFFARPTTESPETETC